jgi:outer membrane biosynthesis protein TonB
MEKKLFILFAVACTLCARGAWYWPFGSDEDSTNAPPRLHRLLEPANDYIELAQDASLNGDSEKAIENYRLALGELDRVEAEHPDRAESSEFAPLRLRRATCMAAIDAIRFAQVNENVRPVSVTDTTELQKRWEKLHGFADEEDEEKTPVQALPKDETKPAPPPKEEEEAKPAPPPKEEAKPVPPPKEEAKPTPPPEEKKPPSPPEEKKPAPLPADWDGRIAQAMSDLRAQDYAAADVLLESMLNERPKDLNALLLRAAAQAGTKSYYAAQRTLERAMRAHPRSYLPYYNLANLLIQQGGDLEAAREYYELGRTVGGPVNKALETRLKGIGK